MAILLVFGLDLTGRFSTGIVTANDSESTKPLPPEIAEASQEPEQAMTAIRIPDGWKISVWAAEPDIANVVAFDIDPSGGIYVCETFRQNRGVTDNRAHDRRWLMADLQSKTVQDRIDYHKRLLGEAAATYAQHDDRIRYLKDSDGDGRADQSVVVADGFHHLEEGTGAGVLSIGNEVYYTCIPKLWKLSDTDGDHRADERDVLSDGYGVRVAFRGHDLHGLIRGYDGRLYFSIGDRGYHIRTPEGKVLSDAASGAVFRCELDGSGLEVFATGLRNPQELAFNDQGDWFTVDNNSDSGDKARIVHLLRGSDAGWRMYYQYLPDRGPFNRERIWEPVNDDQPAFIVPPIANFTDGPSGLAYYPGSGFGDTLQNRFLICDFRGGSSNSGVRSFRVEREGATFRQISDDQPIWSCLATDIAFGPDGALYVSDWVDGWDGLGKARIYRITAPDVADSKTVSDVQKRLARDLRTVSTEELIADLSHVDRRVRLESQWQLADRSAVEALIATASDGTVAPVGRLHATWGMGHLLRTGSLDESQKTRLTDAIVSQIVGDSEELVVAALRLAGDLNLTTAIEAARTKLSAIPHVQYAAVDALGRLGDHDSLGTVLEIAAASTDPAMRHVTSLFASGVASPAELAALSDHENLGVRLLAVIALRRQSSAEIADFLSDDDPRVVLEAARAIHDVPIDIATGALAAKLTPAVRGTALIHRMLQANHRVGDAASAERLARYASSADADEVMRIEALDLLSHWVSDEPLDRVTGDYRPLALENRQLSVAAEAVEPLIDLLLAAPKPIRLKTIDTAAELGIDKIANELIAQFQKQGSAGESRGRALRALAKMNEEKAVELARAVPVESLRGSVGLAVLETLVTLQDKLPKGEGIASTLVTATDTGDLRVKQAAWDLLATTKTPVATDALRKAVQQYIAGELDPKVQLNVLQAAEGQLNDELAERLAMHRLEVAAADPLGPWLDSLAGGNVESGRRLFFEKTELSCVRCHKVARAGGEVGPELTTIAKNRDARYLLESICLPDAKIAEGFETAVIIDIDGRVHGGIVRLETDDYLELILADGTQKRILQDDIEIRRKGNSSMPMDLIKQMSARELRDLVAYLASLKADPRGDGDVE
ncbi:MAG: PVC-type heme-binding CxxCH protein [Planctomycetota bacterium]